MNAESDLCQSFLIPSMTVKIVWMNSMRGRKASQVMNDDFRVVKSLMEIDGSRSHVVQAPGGIVDVREDDAGNLSGRLRSGYVETDESEGQTLARALEAVRELHQGTNSAERTEWKRGFQDE